MVNAALFEFQLLSHTDSSFQSMVKCPTANKASNVTQSYIWTQQRFGIINPERNCNAGPSSSLKCHKTPRGVIIYSSLECPNALTGQSIDVPGFGRPPYIVVSKEINGVDTEIARLIAERLDFKINFKVGYISLILPQIKSTEMNVL